MLRRIGFNAGQAHRISHGSCGLLVAKVADPSAFWMSAACWAPQQRGVYRVNVRGTEDGGGPSTSSSSRVSLPPRGVRGLAVFPPTGSIVAAEWGRSRGHLENAGVPGHSQFEMDSKLLIDAIVQQTTVLIAQLSTAAGIRAPLAHVADQVFLDLARAIEAQGVGRKVVADMFGLAIRTYQKKMQRLTESQTDVGVTLWSAMLHFLQDESVTRERLLQRFEHDPEREVLAVLNDLISSGFVYSTGRGLQTRYGLTSDADRRALFESEELDALVHLVWLEVQRSEPIDLPGLMSRFSRYEKQAEQALRVLLEDGRVTQHDGALTAMNFTVPLGSERGWEAAVLDHFQTMVRAIGAKLSVGRTVSNSTDEIGGSTLSFTIYEGHPREAEVSRLLSTVRSMILPLWEAVSVYNQEHPPPPDARRVSFYFGQGVEHGDVSACEPKAD